MEFLDGLGGEVVEVLVRAFGVEPEHPFGGGEFDVVDVAPRALPADQFVLERPDGGLGQGIVECVTDGPDGGVDAFSKEPAGERHRGVLAAGIGVKPDPA